MPQCYECGEPYSEASEFPLKGKDCEACECCSAPTPRQKAHWGLLGVQAYAKAVGLDANDPDEFPTCIYDLLADLMHLCEQRDIDWDDMLRRADSHYQYETAKEGI